MGSTKRWPASPDPVTNLTLNFIDLAAVLLLSAYDPCYALAHAFAFLQGLEHCDDCGKLCTYAEVFDHGVCRQCYAELMQLYNTSSRTLPEDWRTGNYEWNYGQLEEE